MDAFKLLDKWFASHFPLDWGSKNMIIDKLASTLNTTKKEAKELHKKWVDSK